MPKVKERITRLLEQIKGSTNQKPQLDTRRTSFRYAWPGHATVEFVETDNPSEPLLVTVGHISRGGVDFRSSRKLESEQEVLITLETDQGQLQIPATVMHTTESVLKFVIGVKFDLHDTCHADDQ